MAETYVNSANIPHGLSTVTINSVAYTPESFPDFAPYSEQQITRTDVNGVLSDFKLLRGAELQTGEMVLQRSTDSQAKPPDFIEFTLDYNNSGTASTLVTGVSRILTSKSDMDTIAVPVYLKTYQA